MPAKPLGLQMLWWAEIVVSARALLFLLPVMINKWQDQSLSPHSADDWFLWVATFASLFYLLVGIVALLGHRLWKMFHYVAALVVVALTAGLVNKTVENHAAVNSAYWFPLIFAVIMTIGIAVFQAKPQRA